MNGSLWEEAKPRGRLPDPARRAAVRAVLVVAVALLIGMFGAVALLAGSWMWMPTIPALAACGILELWALVDVAIGRHQRVRIPRQRVSGPGPGAKRRQAGRDAARPPRVPAQAPLRRRVEL